MRNATFLALNNTWSSTNIDDVIYDRLDDGNLPLVIYQRPEMKSVSLSSEGNHILQWSGFNGSPTNTAGETFGIDACTNLNENYWFPVASNLTANVWTNNTDLGKTVYYRNNASTD